MSASAGFKDTPKTSTSDERSDDPAVEALWSHVQARWDDEDAHSGFVQAAETTGNLGFAARRYRGVAGDDKYRVRAESQLKKITDLALAQLDASRTPPPQTKRAVTIAAFVVSLLLIGGCFYAVSR